MDAAHLARRPAQQLGQRAAQRVDALGVAPDRHRPVPVLRQGAGRADRAVHLVRPGVARVQPPDRRAGGPVLVHDLDVAPGQRLDHRGDVVLVRQGRGLLPVRRSGQRPPGLHRLPLPPCHHREVAAVPHHLHHAGHRLDRGGVDGLQHRAGAGLAHGAGVQHAGQPDILDVGRTPRHLGRNVHPRQRGADHRVGVRVLQPVGLRGLHVQRQPGGERAVAERPPVRRPHHAARRLELRVRHPELRRRCPDQQRPHLVGGMQDRGAAVLHRVAAGGEALVRRAAGIGGDQLDGARGQVEPLGRDLQQRRLQPLAQLGLAGEHRHMAVRRHPDPGIQLRRLLQAAGQRCLRRRRAALLGGAGGWGDGGQRKGHDQRAAGPEQGAAGEGGGHPAALPIAAAARRTARRMRAWVPQRHRLGAMWSRISASVGGRVGVQQRLGAHHHAGDAVAALRRLLVDEGTLHQARRVGRAQSLDGADLPARQRGDRHQAGEHGMAVQLHGAGSALAQAAAELGAVQPEIVAQHIQQRRGGIGVHRVVVTVHGQGDHRLPPAARARRMSSATSVQAGRSL